MQNSLVRKAGDYASESCANIKFVCDKTYGEDRSCSYECVSNKPSVKKE